MATSGSGLLVLPHSEDTPAGRGFSVTEESTPPTPQVQVIDDHMSGGPAWSDFEADTEHRLLPPGLPTDPGEVAAKAFNEALRLHRFLPSVRTTCIVVAGLAVATILDAWLPVTIANVVWGMLIGMTLTFFLPLGEMLTDQAWRRPHDAPCWEPATMKPSTSVALTGSLLLLVLPIALGFLVSLAWFTILSVPCASLAVIWLMSSRISPIMEGFPFLHPLGRQETGAVLISGLVAALGSASLALCAHLGPGYRLSTLIFALWTWLFVTRVAGLLARRYFVRVHASEHRSPVQAAGSSTSE